MLPVVVARAPIASSLDVHVDVAIGDVRMRVPIGADVGYVAALVGALRTSC